MREDVLSERAKELKSTVLYCNLVGAQDELVFDGSSLVINPKGEIILCGRSFEEDLLIFDTKKRYKPRKIYIDKVQEMYKALVLGIKDYTRKNNFKKVVIGISGGVDSAVT